MAFIGKALAAFIGLAGLASAGWAQTIYTCVDAQGRRLTADRPIRECLDREQRMLNPSGTVRGTLNPSYTAAERAAIEEKARKEAEERNRQNEERQRIRALLVRFPDSATLDRERAAALATVQDVIATANARSADLLIERRKLDGEAAFYARTPDRMPAELRQSLATNAEQLKAQERFIANQNIEKQRVNERFDEMQRQLQPLWAQKTGASPGR